MAGWVEMGHFVYPTFSFLDQKKSTTFKITIILHYYTLGDWKKRPNSDRYVVVYCLYCLNTSKQKWNASVSCLLLSPPQPSFGLVTQRHLFPVGERQRCVTRQITVAKADYIYCRSSNREKITIICLQLVAKKIWFHVILLQKANCNFVLYPIEPKQRHIAISNEWRKG